MPAVSDTFFLGLDAGGTQTRWAVANGSGALVVQGQAAGLSGLQLLDAASTATLTNTLQAIADATGPVQGVVAGVTGLDTAQVPQLCNLIASAWAIKPTQVQALSDIELTCRAAFAPGEGCVVYAGTGSIAAFIDAWGTLHRAGGRGAVIDDAGGGHWIAREALRQVWRAEDEAPGAWQQSPLARRLFDHIGGSDWALTRAWVYGASRGELGTLALAVAAAADEDPAALAILQAAGAELARLAHALLHRCGPRPLALAGRVFDLHPTITTHLRQALPAGTAVHRLTQTAHAAAAVLAAARTRP